MGDTSCITSWPVPSHAGFTRARSMERRRKGCSTQMGGAVYTNGHLLFLRQTKVFAQAFDAERLELQGSPFEVADGALGRSTSFALTLSAGAGAVAFRAAT